MENGFDTKVYFRGEWMKNYTFVCKLKGAISSLPTLVVDNPS